MGDQIGQIVNSKLIYIPYKEFSRIRNSDLSKLQKLKLLSSLCRINVLYMVANAGSGHLGSSFSSMDIMSFLLSEIELEKEKKGSSPVFFSSKGHDAPALYSVLIGLGNLDFSLIHKLRRLNGLPGHPDIQTSGIVTNTGSLGMGISKAKGMIFSNRLRKIRKNYYVLTGDGELQEGQFWESMISATNFEMGELTVIVDHNKLQSDNFISKVSDLGDLEAKFNSFGWKVFRIDGNDMEEISNVIEIGKNILNKPKIIIADTIKGKGVSFMEHNSLDSDVEYYKFHSGAPNEENYRKAVVELLDLANKQFEIFGLGNLVYEENDRTIIPSSIVVEQEKLVQAYSKALIVEAENNPKIVALDADLILDTGLIPFKEKFPDRFIECGIAEQDMVSIAGGMALNGHLPIVHSFSCFLSSRPNEQLYNNSTERTKIIYVGSLAGLLPAGPGHSHQAVRDISSVSSCPDLIMFEPCCEEETKEIVKWAINDSLTSVYIRLVSIPVAVPFYWSKTNFAFGVGSFIKKGTDLLIISYGPLFLKHAFEVAEILGTEKGISVAVLNHPWLNHFDVDFLTKITNEYNLIFTIDNHYYEGSLGQKINSVLTNRNCNSIIKNFYIEEIPVSGQPEEVLEFHKLDTLSLANKISHYYYNSGN
jgi:transketolase